MLLGRTLSYTEMPPYTSRKMHQKYSQDPNSENVKPDTGGVEIQEPPYPEQFKAHKRVSFSAANRNQIWQQDYETKNVQPEALVLDPLEKN